MGLIALPVPWKTSEAGEIAGRPGARHRTIVLAALLLSLGCVAESSAQGLALPDPSLPPLPTPMFRGASGESMPDTGHVAQVQWMGGPTNPVLPPGGKAVPVTTPYEPLQPSGAPVLPPPIELPKPQTFPPFTPGMKVPCVPGTLGSAPIAKPDTQKKIGKYVQGLVDTEATLDLVVSRTRLMVFKASPKRVQIADDSIAGYTILTATQLSLIGKRPGATVLTFWFDSPEDPKKEEVLSYHVRVYPDPAYQQQLQLVYDALSRQINCLFPDSNVCLKLVGEKIAVSGFAHDIDQAKNILTIVRGHAPDPRSGKPEAAKIPVDRIKPGLIPGEVLQTTFPPFGMEQFDLGAGPDIINLLKVSGEQQVQLRVTVAEVNRAAARSIGLNFTVTNSNGTAVFANNTGLIATGGSSPSFNGGSGVNTGLFAFGAGKSSFGIPAFAGFAAGSGGFNNLPAALDNGQIRLAISALRNLNYARSLAEPNLVAMNGQTAHFQAGGQFPVSVVTGYTAAGLQGVDFVPYGVQLSFTPFITDRDRVRLVIKAVVSDRDLAAGLTNIGGAGVPSLTVRSFETVVEMREGQTLAVAGLIQNNLGGDAARIPFFGDLPVIGRLFSFDKITAGEQELVILITPELVHPMERNEVPPLPGSDIFEPNDVEFYLLGHLEGHYPADFRSPVRTDWSRLHRDYESLYLFGPNGYTPDN